MTDANSMLAAEYVLGTLASSERRDLEKRLGSDPLLREAIADWQARLAPLADGIEEIAPSPAVWDRIDAALDDMQSGANVVPFERPAERRPLIRPRVAAGIFGAIAASVVAFGLFGNSDGVSPGAAPPAVHAVAPPAGQPATRTATAVPCPNDARNAVQTASASREPATQGGIATQGPGGSGSVAVASAARGQGGVVAGGETAAKPESNGNVTTASAPRGNGNVTIASASDPGCK